MSGLPRDLQGNLIQAGDRLAVSTCCGTSTSASRLVIRRVSGITDTVVSFHPTVEGPGLMLRADTPTRALRLS